MRKSILAAVLLLVGHISYSQGKRLTEHNTIGWFTTVITPAVSKKVSLHGEYQWRRVKLVNDWQQSLVRVGVNYKVHPQVTLQAGYAYAQTFAYGTYPLAAVPKDFPEHRSYQQAVVQTSVGKSTLINRFRLEQRWIGKYASLESEKADYGFVNRFRYMPRFDFPINEKWYASVYDEILIAFGKNVGENIFDQNRISAMVGYKASPHFKIEAGFINQTVQLGREIEGKNVIQYNNGFLLTTYINL